MCGADLHPGRVALLPPSYWGSPCTVILTAKPSYQGWLHHFSELCLPVLLCHPATATVQSAISPATVLLLHCMITSFPTGTTFDIMQSSAAFSGAASFGVGSADFLVDMQILALVPTAASQLVSSAAICMPHVLRDRATHVLYVRSLLQLALGRAAPYVRSGLLAVVVEHVVALDCEIRWQDIALHAGACAALPMPLRLPCELVTVPLHEQGGCLESLVQQRLVCQIIVCSCPCCLPAAMLDCLLAAAVLHIPQC